MTERIGHTPPHIDNLQDLLTAAYLVEEEAGSCLETLADQMEVHNNPQMAELFRRMAAMRKEHAAAIYASMEPEWRKEIYTRNLRWLGESCPGAVDITSAHYLMRPWHGLQIALTAKRRIHDFFEAVARMTQDEAVRKRAVELKAAVATHIRAVEEELARTPEPEEHWNHDDDPPVLQE